MILGLTLAIAWTLNPTPAWVGDVTGWTVLKESGSLPGVYRRFEDYAALPAGTRSYADPVPTPGACYLVQGFFTTDLDKFFSSIVCDGETVPFP